MRKHYRLLTAPRVIETESPASWLLRLCYLHQMKFDDVFTSHRLGPPKDIDIASYCKLFKRFAYSGDLPPSHLDAIAKWFEPLVRSSRAKPAVLKEINKTPYSRFCPHCLEQDKIPHFRPEWRLKFWTVCPEHQSKMHDECPECGEHQHTNKVNLKLDAQKNERALQYCLHCNADLTKSCARHCSDKETHDKLIAQDYLLKICRFGKYSVEPYILNPENQAVSINSSYVLTDTQRLIVNFHMAYIECSDNNRIFIGFKNPIRKRSSEELYM